jgi:hypothetical protein
MSQFLGMLPHLVGNWPPNASLKPHVFLDVCACSFDTHTGWVTALHGRVAFWFLRISIIATPIPILTIAMLLIEPSVFRKLACQTLSYI